MADINELVSLLQALDDQLVGCMKCGMCQAVCPLFAQTGKEGDVARGKIALLEGLSNQILHDPDGVNDRLNRCLLCGTCEANCPSGVKVTDIFLKARAIMTGYFGLSPAKKVIFRNLLTHPKLFNSLLDMGSKFQGLFTKDENEIIGSSCARFNAPVIADRHFRKLASTPLHKSVPFLDTPVGVSGKRIAFYPGCVVDKIYPEVAEAAFKVFKHHGVGVFMPNGQACCGIPALASGDRESFAVMVKKNLERFEGQQFDYIITPCATCTSTIKKLWPSMCDSSDSIKAKTLSDKTMDISQFLVDVLGVQPKESTGGAKVTYHDPCHLKNSLGVTAQPRALLAASKGCDFVEMAEAGTCCGSGGSFNLYHYDLSKSIGKRKAENIEASGAQVVATSCPACMMQITDMLSRDGARIKVRHAIQLYADSI
ncbi:MAG: (Fe-S)-binding protein [Desulfovibrio sp.]|uniref:(Fe-S)-binding protein n=1 Tax=Desulfovibrio sp. 7SRBS1 TaxID=3378064 RepID=UPI003B3FC62A